MIAGAGDKIISGEGAEGGGNAEPDRQADRRVAQQEGDATEREGVPGNAHLAAQLPHGIAQRVLAGLAAGPVLTLEDQNRLLCPNAGVRGCLGGDDVVIADIPTSPQAQHSGEAVQAHEEAINDGGDDRRDQHRLRVSGSGSGIR